MLLVVLNRNCGKLDRHFSLQMMFQHTIPAHILIGPGNNLVTDALQIELRFMVGFRLEPMTKQVGGTLLPGHKPIIRRRIRKPNIAIQIGDQNGIHAGFDNRLGLVLDGGDGLQGNFKPPLQPLHAHHKGRKPDKHIGDHPKIKQHH